MGTSAYIQKGFYLADVRARIMAKLASLLYVLFREQ